MKKLQNNFTTPEQSKRLLEIGLPKSSADCCYLCYSDGTVINDEEPDIIPLDGYHKTWQNDIPCWSVGRLIEIIRICNLTDEKPWVYIEQDNISAMIHAIIDGVNNSMLDFSKLED